MLLSELASTEPPTVPPHVLTVQNFSDLRRWFKFHLQGVPAPSGCNFWLRDEDEPESPRLHHSASPCGVISTRVINISDTWAAE